MRAEYTRVDAERIGRWSDDAISYLVRHPDTSYPHYRFWALSKAWGHELTGNHTSSRMAEADLVLARAYLQAPVTPDDPDARTATPDPIPVIPIRREGLLVNGWLALGLGLVFTLFVHLSTRWEMQREYQACAAEIAGGNTERIQRTCPSWLRGGPIP